LSTDVELEEAEQRVLDLKIDRAKRELFTDLEIVYEGYQEAGLEIDGAEWRPCSVEFLVIACGILEIETGYKPKHMTDEDWGKECALMFENAHDVMDGLRGRRLNDHWPKDYYERKTN
jgi:hypothetical protein